MHMDIMPCQAHTFCEGPHPQQVLGRAPVAGEQDQQRGAVAEAVPRPGRAVRAAQQPLRLRLLSGLCLGLATQPLNRQKRPGPGRDIRLCCAAATPPPP